MEGERRDDGFPVLLVAILAIVILGAGGAAFFMFRARSMARDTVIMEEARARDRAAQAGAAARAAEEARRKEAESKTPEPAPK